MCACHLAAEVLQETTSETYLEKPARALYFRQIKRGRGCQYFIHSWISFEFSEMLEHMGYFCKNDCFIANQLMIALYICKIILNRYRFGY